MIGLSPSLAALGDRRTYELKFEVPLDQVAHVCGWAEKNLCADPHGRDGGGYRVTTRYTDRPDLATYFKEPGFRTQKYRLRRYEDEELIYLEMKRKRGNRVQKRRVALLEAELAAWPLVDDSAAWFVGAVSQRHLVPVGTITYRRLAYGAETDRGPVRLTIDLDLHGSTAEAGLTPIPITHGVRLAPGFAPLELKFADSLPGLFRDFLKEFCLAPCSFSKYRSLIETIALPEARGA